MEARPNSTPFLSFIAHVCLVTIFFPGSWIAAFFGYAFYQVYKSLAKTMLIGLVSIGIGEVFGSLGQFLLGRYIFKDAVQFVVKKSTMLQAVDSSIVKKGARLLALLRLSMVVPSNTVNYALGGTKLSVKAFILGTLGSFPLTMVFVYLGSTLVSVNDVMSGKVQWSLLQILLFSIGGLIVLAVVIYISWYVSTEIKLEMKKLRQVQSEMVLLPTQTVETEVRAETEAGRDNEI